MKRKWDKALKIFAVLLIAVGTWFFNGDLFANNHMIKLRFQTGNADTKIVKITMQSITDTVKQEELNITEKDEEGDFYHSMYLNEGTTYKITAISIDQQTMDMSDFNAEFALLHDTLTLTTESDRITFTNEEITYVLNDKPETEETSIEPKAAVAGNVKTVTDELTQRITDFAPDFSVLDWKNADLRTGDIFGSATEQCVFTFGDFIVQQGSEIIGKASIGGKLDNTGTKPMSQIGDTPGAGNGEAPSWSKHSINYIIGADVKGGFSGGIHGWLASSLENTGLTETDTLFREAEGDNPISYKNTYIYGGYPVNETQMVANKIEQYFIDAKANLTAKSTAYMENPLGSVGTVTQESGVTTFKGTDKNFNVFNLSSDQFNAMTHIKIDVPLNSYVQINITDDGELTFIAAQTDSNVLSGDLTTRIDAAGTTPNVDNMDACSHIFWNMPSTTKFTTKQLFCGSILGPNVNLLVEGPSTNGSIIVNSYILNNPGGEAHNYPFKYQKNTPTPTADISISGTKELSGKTWTDETFSIELQDDTGTVLETKEVNKDNKGFKFTKQFTEYDIQTNPYHYIIKENTSNLNSIKDDTKQYDVYVKVKNGGNDSLTIEMSLDGMNYTTTSELVLRDDGASFTNTYFTGSVELSKTLDGKAFSGDSEAEFSLYRYTTTEAEQNEVSNQLVGNYTTTKGKLSVDNLEEGKYFFIEIKAPNGYECSQKLYTFEITANNYTTVKKITADNYQKYGLSIKGSKKLEGRNITDSDNFMVELVANNVVIKSYLINTDGIFQIDLSNMDAGEYSYIIREKQPANGNTANGVTYDTKEYKLDVKVSVDAMGKSSAIVKLNDEVYDVKDGVVQLGDETTPAFKNTYTATGNLSISGTKTLQGRDWSETDTFTIQFLKEDGTLINEKEIKKDDTSFSFTQEYTLADVGKTYHYQVKEKNAKANSIINDKNVYDLYVKVSDAFDGTLNIETSNDNTTYQKGNNIALGNKAFINKYFTGSVELTKTLDGKEFSGNSEAEFSLYRYTSAEATLDDNTNQHIGDYTTSKGKLSVKNLEEGKYFFVEKTAPNGYECSQKLYTFEITADNYATAMKITVDNYQKYGLSIKGSKVLEGRNITDSDNFMVELVANGMVLDRYKIGIDGNFQIDLSNMDAGEYSYIIREEQPANGNIADGVTYDTKEYKLDVKVSVDATGKSSANVKLDDVDYTVKDGVVQLGNDKTPAFKNTYTATGNLSISGTKTLQGRDWSETDSFTIQFLKEDGALINEKEIKKDDTSFSFTQEYTLADVGKTYHYQVKEKDTKSNSIINDNNVYDLYVKVSDAFNGTLKIETSNDGTSYQESNSVALGNKAFINTYFTGSVELTKTLDGKEFSGDSEAEFSLYRYTTTEAERNEANNQFVGNYTTTKGKLSVKDLEEGKYFFVETKAPNGYECSQKLHTFEITADNYTTVKRITVDNYQKASLSLQGSKHLEGRDITDSDQFTVELLNKNDRSVVKTAQIASNGNFTISLLSLSEGNYEYLLHEKQPVVGHVEDGITFDTKEYEINIHVTKDVSGKPTMEVFIDGVKKEIQEGKVLVSTGATFTNQYQSEGTLYIQGGKTLEGRDWKSTDAFLIELYDASDDTLLSSKTLTASDKNFTFIRNYSLDDVGKIYHYQIKEKDEKVNSIIYDTKVYDLYVKISDAKGEALKIETSNDGTSYQESNSVALGNKAFINTYFTGSVVLNKTLDGEAFSGDSEAQFSLYRYTSAEATLDDNTNQHIGDYITSKGKLSVKNLEEGKYFFIEKTAPEGYAQSQTLYTFEITANNYTTVKEITVDNYQKYGLSIKGSKVLEGRNITDSDNFMVELVANNEVIKSYLINIDGNFQIDLSNMDAREYSYIIRERQPANGNTADGVTYDTKEYKLDVKVSVDATGKSSAIVKLDDEVYDVKDGVVQLGNDKTTAFKNTYTAKGNLSISGTKILQGRAWNETDSFTIQFLKDDGAINEKEIKKDDTSFSFTQEYTLADVGKTYHYQVKEKNAKANSIINDNNVYDLYVKVSDAFDGTLNIETSNDNTTYQKGNNVALGNKAFINKYFTGSVELTKTLDGKEFSGNSEAQFSLYRYTSAEATLDDNANQHINDYTTTKGKLSVDNIEEGKYFFVETKAPNGYECSQKLYTFEITADNYATVKKMKIDNYQKASLSLQGSKHLEGREITDSDQFTVELLNKNDRSVVKTAQIAKDGNFTISLPSLSDGNYEYILHEKQPSVGHVEDGITFDTKEYEINIHVTKDVSGKPTMEVFIDGVKKEIQDGKVRVSTGATFTNQYQSKGALRIQGGKTLEGREWKPTDAFLVELYEASSDTLISSQTLTASNKNFIFLRNYSLDDAGKTYHYIIRERSTGVHSIQYDDTLYHLYVKVQDDADGSLKLETSFDNTSFIAGNSVDLGNRAFVNTYVNGSVALTKTLDGKAFHGNSEAEFTLYQYAEGTPSMENDKKTQIGVYTTTNGKLQVDKLETGTYFFVETKAPKGYVLSTKEIPFEITVDNCKTAIQVQADNQKKAELTLHGTKAMIGRDMNDKDHFQVELTDASGTVLQSTDIQSDGTFSFTLNALAEGKHIFNIREKQPGTTDTKGIAYDKKVYAIEVNVEHNISKVKVNHAVVEVVNGNVQLSEQATFTNTYTAKGSLHIHGEKVLKGREWNTQDAFTIQLLDDKGVCLETQRVHKDAAKFSFQRNYTLADAGKTFHYVVREKKETASSILYDTKQYDIYIRVVDNGEGKLSIESSRDGITYAGNADVDLGKQAFVNQYFTGSAEIVKTLDGEAFHGDSEATLALYSYDGKDASLENPSNKLVGSYTTVNGRIHVTGLEEGFYFFVEQSAPNGYQVSDEFYTFTIQADNYTDTKVITVDNTILPKGTITIHKANADNPNQALHKAVYAIYARAECKEQDLLAKLVTDEKGNAESTMLFDAGTYYIREYEAPNGYTLDETVYSITIDEDGNPSIPVLKVEDAPTRILISKVKEDKSPLAGAHLQIKDAQGNIVEEWVSDGHIHTLIGRLHAGESYTLEETQAPKGYAPAKPIVFEVPLYGDVEKKVELVNIALIQSEKPQEHTNPGTGDFDHLSGYIAIFAGSGGLLALLLVGKKRLTKKSSR